MNHSPLLIVPALVCLFWACAHWFLASRTVTFRVLFLLLIAIFFTIAGDVLLDPLFKSDAVAHIFIHLFAPAVMPLACLYYFYLTRPFTYRPAYLLWIALPFIVATGSIVLTITNGVAATDALLERIHTRTFYQHLSEASTLERLYYYWAVLLFRTILIAEFLFMIIYSHLIIRRFQMKPGDLHRFLFKRQPIRLLEIQMWLINIIMLIICLKLLLHASIFHDNKVWAYSVACVHAVLYFLLGLFALFGSKEFISLADLHTLVRANYKPETRSAVAEEIITDMSGYLNGESLTRVMSRLGTQRGAVPGHQAGGRQDTSSLSAAVIKAFAQVHDDSSLPARFQHLVLSERLFLRPNLTLGDVAERLGTNKTYVSKMVNQTYKMGFPELLNILRVDYAQRYIRNHRDASQDEIAKASGFLSASSFNSTFKRITGFTPKVWTARKDSAGQ